jgi:hypothetical protein
MTELATGPATKVCVRCSVEKPATEFHRRSDGRGGGLGSYCKPCVNAYVREQPGGRCQVEGCTEDAPAYKRMCRMHQKRVRLYGDPHKTLHKARGHRDEPDASDAKPVVTLRLTLEHQRTQDVSFSMAWSNAVQEALSPLSKQARREWGLAFASTRRAWQSAFYRLPPPVKHQALDMLRPTLDVESWSLVVASQSVQDGSEPPQTHFQAF